MSAPRNHSLWDARRGRSTGFDAHVASYEIRVGASHLVLPALHVTTRWSDPAHADCDHFEQHQTTIWAMTFDGRHAAERIARDIAFNRPVTIIGADDVIISIGAAHRALVTVDCDHVEIDFGPYINLFAVSRGDAREMWS